MNNPRPGPPRWKYTVFPSGVKAGAASLTGPEMTPGANNSGVTDCARTAGATMVIGRARRWKNFLSGDFIVLSVIDPLVKRNRPYIVCPGIPFARGQLAFACHAVSGIGRGL